VQFRILGQIEICDGARQVATGGARQTTLLGFLLLHANQAVSTERIIDALWHEGDVTRARKSLQVAIARLRKSLEGSAAGSSLRTVSGGYMLTVGPDDLDADVFERWAQAGARALAEGRPGAAAEILRRALGLWRGPALADVAYETFAQEAIRRLEELRLVALEKRIAADLQLDADAPVTGELEALVAAHPRRERFAEALMLSLYRCGRQADALDVYQRVRAHLAGELGLEPGPGLRRAQAAILGHEAGFDAEPSTGGDVVAVKARAREPHVIAAPHTVTVGRETDLEQLRELVDDVDVRLVTLVGPGGVGKTRLALELARELTSEVPDGASVVFLAGVSAPEEVASAIALELGLGTTATEPVERALERHFAARDTLLVLDNLEHLLDATPLITSILAAAPSVTVVATSREPLRLRGERTVPVAPVALPPPNATGLHCAIVQAPAVALFLNAAAAVEPSFELTTDNSAAVVALCRRLDGLPLALELAAGRLKLLSPAEVLRRLDHDLSVLGHGPRDAPARHRTLQTTLQWSYDSLSEEEQTAFARLSVFAAGCELEAAEAVTGAALDVLHSLVDKNMVVAGRARYGASRFSMLETVRQFARERLAERGDDEDAVRRHFDYYLAMATSSRPGLERTAAPALVARVAAELDNVRLALRWGIAHGRAEDVLRLVLALQPYWCHRAELEGVRWLRRALAEDESVIAALVRARALSWHAVVLAEEARFAEAEAAAQRSIEICVQHGDVHGRAESLTSLAKIILFQSRLEDGLRAARDAVAAARQTDDPILLARALAWQASAEPALSDALSLGEQAAAHYRALGNSPRLVDLNSKLSHIAICHGAYDEARRLAEEALRSARETDTTEAFAQGNLGLAALLSGDRPLAAAAFRAEIAAARAEPLLHPLYEALCGLAALDDDPLRTAMLLGAVDRLRTHGQHPVIAAELARRFYAPARARTPEEDWRRAHEGGSRLTLEQALEAALGVQSPGDPASPYTALR
jgi:predicted ATPase/DNA-binding SARP family transcriptional activator